MNAEWIYEKGYDRMVKDELLLPEWHDRLIALVNELTRSNATICQYSFFKRKYGETIAKIITNYPVTKLTNITAKYAVMYNRLDLIDLMPLSAELLFWAARYGLSDMYFSLRKQLTPNLSVYRAAVCGKNTDIILDVDKIISPTKEIVELAFEICDETVVRHLAKTKLKPALYHYLAYRGINIDFPLELKHYHSVILSGDLARIKSLQMPENYLLDQSQSSKGRSNLLLDETIWYYKGEARFSHTMNYAIQSMSLQTIQYIYELGYPITLSNIITAIRQAPVCILSWLLARYAKPIPRYVALYVSPFSYIEDKQAKILALANRLDLTSKLSIKDKKRETAHLSVIEKTQVLPKIAYCDTDYLMDYASFFQDKKELARISFAVRSSKPFELNQMYVDLAYLYQSNNWPKHCPSMPILLELLSYRALNKLCYLKKYGLLPKDDRLSDVAVMLNDPIAKQLFPCHKLKLVCVLLSKNYELIKANVSTITTKAEAKALCDLPIELVKLFPLGKYASYIREYAVERDLTTIVEWLDEASNLVQDSRLV